MRSINHRERPALAGRTCLLLEPGEHMPAVVEAPAAGVSLDRITLPPEPSRFANVAGSVDNGVKCCGGLGMVTQTELEKPNGAKADDREHLDGRWNVENL